jgi:hypothetical protein
MAFEKRKRIRFPEVVEDARRLMKGGADSQVILVFMRDRGLDMADCIYSIQAIFGHGFPDAKKLVVESQAWSDRYEHDEQLRESAREALRILAESNDPKLPKIILEDEKE